jgi:type II secretory pathway pseudopilin PulG
MLMKLHKPGIINGSGFTLIEIAIIIVVLAVIATFGIPVMGNMINSSRTAATRNELSTLKTAIVGKTGVKNIRGYENDLGTPPADLKDLYVKPAGVSNWNKFTRTGWNGPYIDGDNGNYLRDAWGVDYAYDSEARTIRSVGGPDTITVVF